MEEVIRLVRDSGGHFTRGKDHNIERYFPFLRALPPAFLFPTLRSSRLLCTYCLQGSEGRVVGMGYLRSGGLVVPSPLPVLNSVGLEGQHHPGSWSGRWTCAQLFIPLSVSLVLILTPTLLSSGILEGVTGFRFGVGKARGLTSTS